MWIILDRRKTGMLWDKEVNFDYSIITTAIPECGDYSRKESHFVRFNRNDFRYVLDDGYTVSNITIVFSEILEEEYNKWLVEKILLGDG